ncbi:hypothetical protein FKP32DRAFT_1597589 [Trametes sanguinea]|nr:hypothetical protein FKP32DRAFT_1597589 [Trametes sanguinea]
MTSEDGFYSRLSPDIWKSICRMLLHGASDCKSEGFKTVANLSLTCKHIRDSALDVMWHAIPNITAVFHILPGRLYRRESKSRSDGDTEAVYCFQDGVRKEDLKSFFAYARRVRAIDISKFSDFPTVGYAAPSVYDVLATFLQGQPLCPNIKLLRYYHRNSMPLSVFRSFHILFGPQLQEVDLGSRNILPVNRREDGDDEHCANMLRMLKARASTLRKLQITLNLSGNLMQSAVTPLVCALTNPNLVSVQLARGLPLEPEAFFYLGSLPSLQVLSVGVNDDTWTTYLASDPHENSHSLFPSLRKLQILVRTLAVPIKLLSFVVSPKLNELNVTAYGRVLRHELCPVFTAIASIPSSRSNLITLFVRIEDVLRGTQAVPDADPTARSRWSEADHIPDPIGEKTLEPLLAMTQLEDITLEIDCPFDIDDALMRRFAASWRNLNRLGLKSDFPVSEYPEGSVNQLDFWRTPRASIASLQAFAELCPKLTVLSVEFDANLAKVPRWLREPRPQYTTPLRPLTTLCVGLSTIQDPLSVAAFLSAWFPSLLDVYHGWDALEEDDDEDSDAEREDSIIEYDDWSEERAARVRWERVQYLIAQFAEIRRQERQWAPEDTGVVVLSR